MSTSQSVPDFEDDATAYGVRHGTQTDGGIAGYWKMFELNPVVHACVSKIVQASTDYEFVPIQETEDDLTDEMEYAEACFSAVNELDSGIDVLNFAKKQLMVQGYGPIEFEVKPSADQPLGMWNVEGETVPKVHQNSIQYYLHRTGLTWERLDRERILWIRNPSKLSIYPFSPLECLRDEVKADAASMLYNLNFYEHPTHFGHDVEVDGDAEKVREVRAMIESQHKGSKNAFRNLYHGTGVAFNRATLSNREMENSAYIESMSDRIRMVYGVPPMMLGLETPGQLGGKEDQMKAFDFAVQAWERPIVYAINRHIMPQIAPGLKFAFIHDDTTTKKLEAEIKYQEARTDALLAQNRILTADEVRAKRGLEPLGEDSEGELL